jgi:hypothetical protein
MPVSLVVPFHSREYPRIRPNLISFSNISFDDDGRDPRLRQGWPKTFGSLAARIRPALGDLVERIEHVGTQRCQDWPLARSFDIDVVRQENQPGKA